MSEIEKRRGFHYGFLIVACCCVFSATSVSLAFGCAGVFYTPVSEAIGVSRGVFVISFTCMSLTAGIGVKIMTPFVEKYSLKLAVIILLLFTVGLLFCTVTVYAGLDVLYHGRASRYCRIAHAVYSCDCGD